jgi:hypothetical protein
VLNILTCRAALFFLEADESYIGCTSSNATDLIVEFVPLELVSLISDHLSHTVGLMRAVFIDVVMTFLWFVT